MNTTIVISTILNHWTLWQRFTRHRFQRGSPSCWGNHHFAPRKIIIFCPPIFPQKTAAIFTAPWRVSAEAQPFLWLWSFLFAPLWRLCSRLPGLAQAVFTEGGTDGWGRLQDVDALGGIYGESMGNLWGIYREFMGKSIGNLPRMMLGRNHRRKFWIGERLYPETWEKNLTDWIVGFRGQKWDLSRQSWILTYQRYTLWDETPILLKQHNLIGEWDLVKQIWDLSKKNGIRTIALTWLYQFIWYTCNPFLAGANQCTHVLRACGLDVSWLG